MTIRGEFRLYDIGVVGEAEVFGCRGASSTLMTEIAQGYVHLSCKCNYALIYSAQNIQLVSMYLHPYTSPHL